MLILPLTVVSMSGVFSPSNKNYPESFNQTVWYYQDETGNETLFTFDEKLDVEVNEKYTIYTYLNLSSTDDTLYVSSNQQTVQIYLDGNLIYDNDTSSKRLFGKAEQSKFHIISLPEDCDCKKLSITFSSPYSIYSGKVDDVVIASRRLIIDKLFNENLLYLVASMLFLCSSIAVFVSSFFFLKQYDEFNKMNELLFATILLSVFFIFESKILTIFMDGYVSNISYLSLIIFNIFVCKFAFKGVKERKERFIPLTIMIISFLHLIAACVLQLFNVMDLFETVTITLILQNVVLIYLAVSNAIQLHKAKKANQLSKIMLFESVVTWLLVVCNILVAIINASDVEFILISGTIYYIYVYIRYSISIHNVVTDAKKSIEYESELKETKNYLINSQMKSHFVFNTLGAIRTMIISHPKLAYEMTTDFTKYLRANISKSDPSELIPFTSELDHIKAYLNIEKQRFQNRLNIIYDIKATDFNIPPLSVEPLVENAVKHGVCKKLKGGTVTISTEEFEDCFVIKVIDDGVGFDIDTLDEAGKNGHVGLRYIKTRLNQLANADFEIISEKNKGTKSIITVKKNHQK